MTFLACLTAGGALLVAEASQAWRGDVLRDVTIQIKPARRATTSTRLVAKAADDRRASARRRRRARLSKRRDPSKLLEPWLGDGSISAQLPIPRLIVVHMQPGHRDDLEPLRAALAPRRPQAEPRRPSRCGSSRLDVMAGASSSFAAALFALMIVAMATAIGFATRGAMAGNREIVEVLHFVGAADSFIAGQFQAHFLRLGLAGRGDRRRRGVRSSSPSRRCFPSWRAHSPGGEEIAALFGSFALGLPGYAAIAVVAGASPAHRRSVARDRLPPSQRCCNDADDAAASASLDEPPCSRCARSPSTSLFYVNLSS